MPSIEAYLAMDADMSLSMGQACGGTTITDMSLCVVIFLMIGIQMFTVSVLGHSRPSSHPFKILLLVFSYIELAMHVLPSVWFLHVELYKLTQCHLSCRIQPSLTVAFICTFDVYKCVKYSSDPKYCTHVYVSGLLEGRARHLPNAI